MRAAISALLILASGDACAQWERTDTAMLAGAMTLIVVDWGQARDMVKRQASEGYHENNPLLPEHPTTADINHAAIIGLAGTAGLAYVLPQQYRRWFLGGVIVIETAVVAKNHQIGLRVSF